MQEQDQYILEEEITDEKFHIRIFRPVLTDEEREKRMKRIHDAAACVMKAKFEAERRRSECADLKAESY